MKLLKLANLIEEFQDYIAANSGLGYVVGENFTAENVMEYQDIARLTGSRVLLTMFDEGGDLIPTGRQTHQQKFFRFVCKGDHANQALDRCRALLVWIWNHRTLRTSTYRIWVARLNRSPTVIDRGESGSYLADFVMEFAVFNRT